MTTRYSLDGIDSAISFDKVSNMIYINQRKKSSWNGILSPIRQCFYCSSVSFASYYDPKAKEEKYYIEYVDDTEALVGKPGIAEKFFPKLKGRTGAFWAVHRKALEVRLPKYNIIFKEKLKWIDVRSLFQSGEPIIIGTKKLGGVPDGHIVVAVRRIGLDGTCIYDSFGDARTNYENHDGEGVVYSDELMEKHFSGRIIYAERKK